MSDSEDLKPNTSKKRKTSRSEAATTSGSHKPGELPASEGTMEAKKRRLIEIIFESSKGLKADDLAEQVSALCCGGAICNS